MIIRKKTREVSKKHVHKKLIFKLRRLALVFFVITTIIVYDVLSRVINPLLALTGVLMGFFIGSLLGRYSNVHWHEETGKVISKWNRITIAVLIIYLSFAFSKKWIFGHWLQGPVLTAFSFSLASGIMTGRIISIRKQIRSILRERGHLSSGKA
jgi:Na+/H+ antiporter NhaC